MQALHRSAQRTAQQICAAAASSNCGAEALNGCRMVKREAQAGACEARDRTNSGRSVFRPLEGREKEIALIDRLIQRIDRGGATLVITGEPGIGKSALLEEARRRAIERNIATLIMTGAFAEVHLPFAALEHGLRPLMGRITALVPRQQSALQSAFGVHDDIENPDIFLVAAATLSLLTEGAKREPILVVADDAQWFDQATCDVLAYISRRLSTKPIILLVAMRDCSNRPFGDASVLRHRLSRLDAAAAERLLDVHAQGISAELRNRILKEASGNPLALLELSRAELAAEARNAPWLRLTERLERAFSGCLSDLPEATRTLLFVAAENDRTSLHEILQAGGAVMNEPVEIDALAPAIAAKLIEVEGNDVQFRHPLTRSAMHQVADPALRQKIHAAYAAILRDQPDRRLWHRSVSTIGPDDELANEHDRMAERAVRRGALITAIEVLENAARLSSTVRARCRRLLRAAELASDLGRAELLERLIGRVDIEEMDRLAAVRIGWCRELGKPPTVGDPSKVSVLTGLAIQAYAAGAEDLGRNLLWRAAQRCRWSDASDELRTRVLEAAERLKIPKTDPRLISIYAYTEPVRRGSGVVRELQKFFEGGACDPSSARVLGSACNVVGAFDLSVRFLADSNGALRAQGRLGDLARMLFAQGWAEMEIGDWTGAMREAEESIRVAEVTNETLWTAAATILKAKLAGMQGNLEQAEAYAAQAERLIVPIGATFLWVFLRIARGISAIGAGEHGRAYEHLRRVFVRADLTVPTGLEFFGLADFVEAAVLSGNGEAAHSVLNEIDRISAPRPVPWVETMLLYGKALLARPEDSEQFFLRGLGPTAKTWPFLRGRLLLAYGGLLRRQRRPTDARAPLREAGEIFDALGAVPWSDRARRELRASGEAGRHRIGRTSKTFTPQELHIAQLAAEGLSNKEIGAKLCLSHRTIGYHLRGIFSKLGITSRSELRGTLVDPGPS